MNHYFKNNHGDKPKSVWVLNQLSHNFCYSRNYVIVGAVVSIFLFLPNLVFAFGQLEQNEIVTLTNEFRTTEGLPELEVSELLRQAAQLKAEDMGDQGYFAHVGPDGKEPVYWLEDVDYNYWFTGENIAAGTAGFFTPERAVELWKNSTGHRANMLGENYTEIGIGVATGLLEGEETKFYVQIFGKPRGVNPEPLPEPMGEPTPEKSEQDTEEIDGVILQEEKKLEKEDELPQESISIDRDTSEQTEIDEESNVEETLITEENVSNTTLPAQLATYSILLLMLSLILKKIPF